jgi:ribosome biogenesis GTPase
MEPAEISGYFPEFLNWKNSANSITVYKEEEPKCAVKEALEKMK